MLQLINREEEQIAILLTMAAVRRRRVGKLGLGCEISGKVRQGTSGCLQLLQKPSPTPKFLLHFP